MIGLLVFVGPCGGSVSFSGWCRLGLWACFGFQYRLRLLVWGVRFWRFCVDCVFRGNSGVGEAPKFGALNRVVKRDCEGCERGVRISTISSVVLGGALWIRQVKPVASSVFCDREGVGFCSAMAVRSCGVSVFKYSIEWEYWRLWALRKAAISAWDGV